MKCLGLEIPYHYYGIFPGPIKVVCAISYSCNILLMPAVLFICNSSEILRAEIYFQSTHFHFGNCILLQYVVDGSTLFKNYFFVNPSNVLIVLQTSMQFAIFIFICSTLLLNSFISTSHFPPQMFTVQLIKSLWAYYLILLLGECFCPADMQISFQL